MFLINLAQGFQVEYEDARYLEVIFTRVALQETNDQSIYTQVAELQFLYMNLAAVMKPGMAVFYSSTGVVLLWQATKQVLYAKIAVEPQKRIRQRIHPGVVLSYSNSKYFYLGITVMHHRHINYLCLLFEFLFVTLVLDSCQFILIMRMQRLELYFVLGTGQMQIFLSQLIFYVSADYRNIMEESLRRKRQKSNENFATLPLIKGPQRPLKQVLNTQNAFKLCRVGVRKSKFINFDLKYTQDENALMPSQQNIKIPLLMYNKNKFSPFRDRSAKKSPTHPLLVSRLKQQQSLPSIHRCELSNIRSAKFTREREFIEQNPNLFIT